MVGDSEIHVELGYSGVEIHAVVSVAWEIHIYVHTLSKVLCNQVYH